MDTSKAQENEIAALRTRLGLKNKEFAEKLGCKESHACDLCSGRRKATQRIAFKLQEISGRPWHEWMAPPANSDASAHAGQAA